MQPAGGIIMGILHGGGMPLSANEITRGTVSFYEAAFLCQMDTGSFWEHIRDAVILTYPKLNEFWLSIAPACLTGNAVPPERLFNARFPLYDVLEIACRVSDSSIEEVIQFVSDEYHKMYPPEDPGNTTRNDEVSHAGQEHAAPGTSRDQGKGVSPSTPEGDGIEKITINVPPSLWAGKTLEAAFNNLREADFGDAVIAYILVMKMETPKTTAGRLLFPPAPGEEKEDSTYLRKIDTCIRKATAQYNITFFE
jgi:hypothetical protein